MYFVSVFSGFTFAVGWTACPNDNQLRTCRELFGLELRYFTWPPWFGELNFIRATKNVNRSYDG
jgi:hypothetical protein